MSKHSRNATTVITTNEDTVLISALQVNLPLFGICCAIYVVLHTTFRHQYYQNPSARRSGPPPPKGTRLRVLDALDFVTLVWKMSDDDFERYAGLDAWALIEFIRVVLRVLGGYGAYGLTVSVITTGGSSHLRELVGDSVLARVSLANMESFTTDDVTWDMWGTAASSVLGCYLLTYLVISRLKEAWRKMIARRLRSLADARDTSSLVVLVRSAAILDLRMRGKRQTMEEVRELW